MNVLSINCGSSSIKTALIAGETHRRLAEVRIEEVGKSTCKLHVSEQTRALGEKTTFEEAAALVVQEARAESVAHGGIHVIAHRIVHGGERFLSPIRIDTAALRELDALSELAPLHNLPALMTVRVAMKALPNLPHVAVFDTAFHATLPTHARLYALPADVTKQFGIRRFGFHGTSHAHVSSAVAQYLKTTAEQLRVISCHLGNGASVTAIEHGRSVETSMGMTPLEGLVMGTRAGDLDPGVMIELMRAARMGADALDTLLNHRSGLIGLTGTNDMREIEKRAGEGDESCRVAIALYSHRVRKYIGAYAAVMGGVDAIAFTGGIGENSALMRERCTQRLDFLGAVLDEARNRDVKLSAAQPIAEISMERSRVRITAVKADEEIAIAQEAHALLERGGKPNGKEA